MLPQQDETQVYIGLYNVDPSQYTGYTLTKAKLGYGTNHNTKNNNLYFGW